MGEPDNSDMHNFAYHPNVANWVHSTSLAQLNTSLDDQADQSPDAFYRSPYHLPPQYEPAVHAHDMTSTRQRQHTPNGAVRSTSKPSVRSVSGPPSSIAAARAAQVPVNRPTVKSLAQRFNQPSSAESSPPSTRVRPARTASSAKSISESLAQPESAPSSPAREAVYGSYKFNNLKPRERPQPAPATPSSGRRYYDRSQAQRGTPTRQPFFGEVVGEHDAGTPGFGIPSVDPTPNDSDPIKQPIPEQSTIKLVNRDLNMSPQTLHFGYSPLQLRRNPSDKTSTSAGRRSPPSRIPVSTRRRSIASDSGSSNRSLKFSSTGAAYRTSPIRNDMNGRRENGVPRKPLPASAQQRQPSSSHRGYRERGKSSAVTGPSLTAVITAPPRPASPRLRHSNERQFLSQEDSKSTIRAVDPNGHQDYFDAGNDLKRANEPYVNSFGIGEQNTRSDSEIEMSPPLQAEPSARYHNQDVGLGHQALSVHTNNLPIPQIPAPLSATTDFEQDESPILGMPGSFLMTPPMAQNTPPVGSTHVEHTEPQPAQTATLSPELLQAHTFRPLSRDRPVKAPSSEVPYTAPSEFGASESIPIMLGADEQQPDWITSKNRFKHSPRLSMEAHKWGGEPRGVGTMSFLDDDSPIDPFANRDSIRPDDSASVAFYRQAERQIPDWSVNRPALPESRHLTIDREAYSVINKVLNLYHQSASISPEMAYNCQQQIHGVSPIIAQHRDWGSKEATETYLARLLSDATVAEANTSGGAPTAEGSTHTANAQIPSLSIRELDEDPSEPHVGGTAIIFPSESRRYSRGSRGSHESNATTIWDDGSRAGGSSVNLARDVGREDPAPIHLPASTYASNTAPKGRNFVTPIEYPSSAETLQRISSERPTASFDAFLPEIEGAGEGLGLSLQASQQQESLPTFACPPPPRPAYSPPPPPVHPFAHQAKPVTPPGAYYQQPPSPDKMGQAMSVVASDPAVGASQHAQTDSSDDTANALPVPDNQVISADPLMQALRQRYRVLSELIDSEKSFCIDMMLAATVFEDTAEKCLTERERRILFSNAAEIDTLSHAFYGALKKACRPITQQKLTIKEKKEARAEAIKAGQEIPHDLVDIDENEEWDEFEHLTVENDLQTFVGSVLNEFLPKLEKVFSVYLLNHSDASALIKLKADEKEFSQWVSTCFQCSKEITNAWDLDSLLVKPVQRIMKYPLLFEQLAKATDPNHPDLPAIKAAHTEVVEINVRINEARKRQETLREAAKEGKKKNKGLLDKGLGKTFFVKPFSSKTDRKQLAGTSTPSSFSDDEYDFLSQKFGGHFFQIQVVIRDVDSYLDRMTEFVNNTNCFVITFIALLESAPSSHAVIESQWRRQAMAFFELQNVALEEHKAAVRNRVLKPITELWNLHGRPQKMMDQRKKGLPAYIKYRQTVERKDKADPKLEETAQQFTTVNTKLKLELPKMYQLTKTCVRSCLTLFAAIQKDWWKTCQKKMLPLLEIEPEHTTLIAHDLKAYQDRFNSDFASVEAIAERLAITNHQLLQDVQNYMSPLPAYIDDSSSRKSSSRRTESMSSNTSMIDPKKRYSGGHSSQRNVPTVIPLQNPPLPAPARDRGQQRISPSSERSDITLQNRRRAPSYMGGGLDGSVDYDYLPTSSIGSSLLSPFSPPGSSRASGVFNSALPMSDDPNGNRAEMPTTPATPMDQDEPEVLFLAASLFEFNIAHDRREGGIPYLVYVPGEIFDVIGMKGELWLARNQDDSSRTVGWIWEKHFARILPEDG